MKYNIVIGGGISGLFSAHTLQKRFPHIPVIIIESAPKVGGLLKSKSYGKHGVFDYGIHTFYETNIADIDDYFMNLPIDWNFLEEYERDLGGATWDTHVNYNSPYLDLARTSGAKNYRTDIENLITNKVNAKPQGSANDWLISHFGANITKDFMAPIIEARQHQNAKDVHWLATKVQGLGRVSLFSDEDVHERYTDPNFSSRIAFPNQRKYPRKILPTKRGYYPQTFGLGRVIDVIEADLLARGVTILTGAKLARSVSDGECVSSVVITHRDNKTRTYDVNRLICAVPLPAFLFTLDKKPEPQPFAPPHQTVLCNLISKTRPKDGGLYYIHFHGHSRIHRVSFPYTYSRDDPERRGYAIAIECVYPRGETAENAADMVIAELVRTGIINQPDDIIFQDSFVSTGGFPNLSISNVNGLNAYRAQLHEMGLKNVDNVGILAKDDLFFQFDLIQHANEVLV